MKVFICLVFFLICLQFRFLLLFLICPQFRFLLLDEAHALSDLNNQPVEANQRAREELDLNTVPAAEVKVECVHVEDVAEDDVEGLHEEDAAEVEVEDVDSSSDDEANSEQESDNETFFHWGYEGTHIEFFLVQSVHRSSTMCMPQCLKKS